MEEVRARRADEEARRRRGETGRAPPPGHGHAAPVPVHASPQLLAIHDGPRLSASQLEAEDLAPGQLVEPAPAAGGAADVEHVKPVIRRHDHRVLVTHVAPPPRSIGPGQAGGPIRSTTSKARSGNASGDTCSPRVTVRRSRYRPRAGSRQISIVSAVTSTSHTSASLARA